MKCLERTDAIGPSVVVKLEDKASVVASVVVVEGDDVVVVDTSCDDVIVKQLMNTRIVRRTLMTHSEILVFEIF